MNVKDQIASEVKRLRGARVMEPLTVVPIAVKRCFMPCKAGRCNCYATVDKKFCVVGESQKQRCLEEANAAVDMLNLFLKEVEAS